MHFHCCRIIVARWQSLRLLAIHLFLLTKYNQIFSTFFIKVSLWIFRIHKKMSYMDVSLLFWHLCSLILICFQSCEMAVLQIRDSWSCMCEESLWCSFLVVAYDKSSRARITKTKSKIGLSVAHEYLALTPVGCLLSPRRCYVCSSFFCIKSRFGDSSLRLRSTGEILAIAISSYLDLISQR